MKRYIFSLAAVMTSLTLSAQHFWELNPQPADLKAARTYRTEVVPYDTRHDAEARKMEASGYSIDFRPEVIVSSEAMSIVGKTLEIPYAWTDGVVYLHLENVGQAYSLYVNDTLVADVEDPLTPAEFHLTPLVRQGENSLKMILRPSRTPHINPVPSVKRAPFAESYLYYQEKRSLRDFEMALIPDSMRRDGILELKILTQNAYNYDEQVEVGYDIYSPQGKLLDFNIRSINIPGRSTDTVKFNPFIYHVNENRWSASTKAAPPIYKVMLFTRRHGAYKEYMPLRIGYGRAELQGDQIVMHDVALTLRKTAYNAAESRTTTLTEMKALKAKGFNTLCPSYPQPRWYYELATDLGLYVIDCAAISAPQKRTDRTIGGTPSNDPKMVDEYIERVKAMYYRSRNFTCVVAFSLGNPSGNGYAMQKAYEWLKGVEKYRPVIYEDAAGEWNSDL